MSFSEMDQTPVIKPLKASTPKPAKKSRRSYADDYRELHTRVKIALDLLASVGTGSSDSNANVIAAVRKLLEGSKT